MFIITNTHIKIYYTKYIITGTITNSTVYPYTQQSQATIITPKSYQNNKIINVHLGEVYLCTSFGGGFCVKSTNFMDFNINHQVSTANYCVHNSLLASPIREVYQ